MGRAARFTTKRFPQAKFLSAGGFAARGGYAAKVLTPNKGLRNSATCPGRRLKPDRGTRVNVGSLSP
jgi:hypothetical protein